MKKIASPQDLQVEIQSLLAYSQGSETPSREKLAFELRELADCVNPSTRSAGGPRPRSFSKWEADADKVEKGLGALYFQVNQIGHDGDMTDDEVRSVSNLIGAAQKALDKAINKINRI